MKSFLRDARKNPKKKKHIIIPKIKFDLVTMHTVKDQNDFDITILEQYYKIYIQNRPKIIIVWDQFFNSE